MTNLLMAVMLTIAAEPEEMEWTINGESRDALVFAASKESSAGSPIVFAFHGHGGNARRAAGVFRIHELWPEAVAVYPQGLPTKTRLDPQGLRPGWQPRVGENGDRDLKFVDGMLETLSKKYRINRQAVFATGHSNGAGFTYLLWSQRPKVFTAFAPSAAAPPLGESLPKLEPHPAMHIAGEKDPVVPFERQKLVMEAVKKVNHCEGEGHEWAKGCTMFPSNSSTPFVTVVHPGDHAFPASAPKLIVRFFQEQLPLVKESPLSPKQSQRHLSEWRTCFAIARGRGDFGNRLTPPSHTRKEKT